MKNVCKNSKETKLTLLDGKKFFFFDNSEGVSVMVGSGKMADRGFVVKNT